MRNGWITINARFPLDSLFGLTPLLLYINDFSDVFCNISVNTNDAELCSKCDWASDLWQQLELSALLKFDVQDAVD